MGRHKRLTRDGSYTRLLVDVLQPVLQVATVWSNANYQQLVPAWAMHDAKREELPNMLRVPLGERAQLN